MKTARNRLFEMFFVLAASVMCATPVLAVLTWFLLPLQW